MGMPPKLWSRPPGTPTAPPSTPPCYNDTFKWYHQEGMSSEKSEVEDIEEVYHPKWRKSASEMKNLINTVKRPPGQRSHLKKGSPPTWRVFSKDNAISTQTACQCLPIELYDSHWFDGPTRSERVKLKASLKPFEFIYSFIGATEDLEGEITDNEGQGGDGEESESEGD